MKVVEPELLGGCSCWSMWNRSMGIISRQRTECSIPIEIEIKIMRADLGPQVTYPRNLGKHTIPVVLAQPIARSNEEGVVLRAHSGRHRILPVREVRKN